MDQLGRGAALTEAQSRNSGILPIFGSLASRERKASCPSMGAVQVLHAADLVIHGSSGRLSEPATAGFVWHSFG